MPKSNFDDDLSKESILGRFLDEYYLEILSSSNYTIRRVGDISLQYKGVDLILSHGDKKFYVDEKAQLDYINKSLPTFAFEISYLKNQNWHLGWLLDDEKLTDIYFLISNIYTKQNSDLSSGLSRIKIIGIYREKLQSFLNQKGLNKLYLLSLEKQIRAGSIEGKIPIKELDGSNEGAMYFSKQHKNEQPINLVLKLKFLLDNSIAKILYELE